MSNYGLNITNEVEFSIPEDEVLIVLGIIPINMNIRSSFPLILYVYNYVIPNGYVFSSFQRNLKIDREKFGLSPEAKIEAMFIPTAFSTPFGSNANQIIIEIENDVVSWKFIRLDSSPDIFPSGNIVVFCRN